MLYKPVAILFVFCLVCYIVFSRSPDYFDSEFANGVIDINAKGEKILTYSIDRKKYKVIIEGWGASQVAKGETVRIIYNPSDPAEASLYSFFAYWFKLKELLFSIGGCVILFIAAVFITGKETPYYYTEEELRKKRKYDD